MYAVHWALSAVSLKKWMVGFLETASLWIVGFLDCWKRQAFGALSFGIVVGALNPSSAAIFF